MLPKIDLEIEHVLIGVENLSRFRMPHVQKVGSDFRLRVSSALVSETPIVIRIHHHLW